MQTKTVIAVNRFGLGARPGDLETVDRGPRRWLLDQLQGPSAEPAELRGLPDSAAVLVAVQDLRRIQRMQRQGQGDEAKPGGVREYGRTVRGHYMQQAEARYRLAAATSTPFFERLVHFWSNHFAVSADKQPMPAVAGLFEKEAIRPNITGRFADLLIAAEQHPAMLLYLDNQRSIGPNSTLGRRANRVRDERNIGLNENLAREILELHTLGVAGGYSQDDVTTFARVITGWSIGGAADGSRFAEGRPGTFQFREVIHEPGAHRVLGTTYPQRGVAQGEAVLSDLAVHRSTAHFLCSKLARHFISDDPDPQLVDRLAGRYLETGGDLPTVYEALIDAALESQTMQAKYKSPHDFVISAFRAFDHVPDNPRFVVGALDLLGQAPYRPGSPAGWPDTAEDWGGADALYKRIEWSNTVARVVASRVNPVNLGAAVLGPAFAANTRKAVSRAESEVQGMTLLLASPEFQRR